MIWRLMRLGTFWCLIGGAILLVGFFPLDWWGLFSCLATALVWLWDTTIPKPRYATAPIVEDYDEDCHGSSLM